MPLNFFLSLFLIASLSACSHHLQMPSNQILKTEENTIPTSSWWQSDGYGYLIYLGNKDNRFFQISNKYCIEQDIGDEKLHDFYARYRINDEKNQIEFFGSFDSYPYRYNRISKPPESCLEPLTNNPLNNFDVFVDIFDTHYAFFDLYDVNWGQRIKQFRSQINAQTTDQELFQILAQTLEGIKDGHINIKAQIDGKNNHFRGNPGSIDTALNQYVIENDVDLDQASNQFHNHYWLTEIPITILGNKGYFTGNKRMQYGLIDHHNNKDSIGYFAAVSVASLMAKDSEFETLSEAVDDAMNQAISLFNDNDVKAVIIDLSVNYGGYDFVSKKIAERFAANKTKVYTKVAADATQPKSHGYQLNAESEHRYLGPVYVMTSNITVSGGETLVMGLKSLPNVTHVGETTRGALSDKLEKTLPNGWEVTLSNEVYKDHQGNEWEGLGIPPEIEFTVFDWQKPMNGHIDAINQLVKIILKREIN